jgi:UDP-GlcNAc:undecaprenyl-phosphate GlcNAc-1-phosphate transferase
MTAIQGLSFAIVFGVALGSSLLLTSLAQWLGFRLKLIDRPRARHRHPRPVSKFGGLALYGAFTIAALVAQFMPIERTDPNELIRFTGLIIGGLLAFVFGTLDDRFEFPALPQYISQLLIAAIGVAFLIFIEKFNNPLTGEVTAPWPYFITATISLFWLGLMMNTINWLDGMDGLSGGVTLIGGLLLFVHTVRENQLSVSLLPLALIGAVLGFLIFNWHPASIFMGGGALFLGYTLGALSIIGGAKMATILLVMGLPLLDVAWQIVRRTRQGHNPMIGDRGHIHFRLIDRGVSPRIIAAGYYVFCTAFGALALITSSRQFKLLALAVMVALIFIGFGLVARYAPLRPNAESASDDLPDSAEVLPPTDHGQDHG